jgi:hypothetical protein
MQLLTLKYKIIVFLIFLLVISSCTTLKSIEQQKEIIFIPFRSVSSVSVKSYTGWWVYGEDQHIFKDEVTMEEYDLTFPNENMVELVELYLSVCEMEYFPMECEMTGILKGNILEVSNFEILYIQGCGE